MAAIADSTIMEGLVTLTMEVGIGLDWTNERFACHFLVHEGNTASADIQQRYENYAQKKVI